MQEGSSQRKSSPPHDKHSKNKDNWIRGEHLVAQCRSGGATPALPLPEILPTSLLPSLLLFHWILERKCWQSPPSALLHLCLPLFYSFFLSFPPHLILSQLPTTLFLFNIPASCIPRPPLALPDTTKSATCGLNGKQTLTHSTYAYRLFPCTHN